MDMNKRARNSEGADRTGHVTMNMNKRARNCRTVVSPSRIRMPEKTEELCLEPDSLSKKWKFCCPQGACASIVVGLGSLFSLVRFCLARHWNVAPSPWNTHILHIARSSAPYRDFRM